MSEAGTSKKVNRLAGHELWAEGRAIESRTAPYETREGRAECSCGEQSPVLPNKSQRKQWHREHKDSARAAGQLGHGAVK